MLHRTGAVELTPEWDSLSNGWVLLSLGTIFVLDFIGDKVPLIDHALHAVGTVAHPVAGFVLFDSQSGAEVPTLVSIVAGGGTAGALHAARATARPIISGASAGAGAPVASFVEDVMSALLVLFAFVLPVLAVLMLIGLFFAFYRAARRAARLAKRGRAVDGTGPGAPPPPPPPAPI